MHERKGSPEPAKRFSKFNWAATLTFDSIFYSGTITCFVYLCANRTLLLQQRTGHLGAQPVETHLYPNCFSASLSFVLTAILNSQAGCRCTLVPRLPFPVPRSPFPVPGISNILGMASSFIKLMYSSDTLTKRQAVILKICPHAIITSAEVIIAEYDAILGQ